MHEPDVSLRLMREAEFPAFRGAFVRAWAEDLRRIDGLGEEEALTEAATSIDQALPAGVATPDALLFVIDGDGRPVGTLWLEIDRRGNAHIADITIDEPHRGRGYGGRALELAEEEARRSGAGVDRAQRLRRQPRRAPAVRAARLPPDAPHAPQVARRRLTRGPRQPR
jgi:GNAT superfamily N-acetyltransferase